MGYKQKEPTRPVELPASGPQGLKGWQLLTQRDWPSVGKGAEFKNSTYSFLFKNVGKFNEIDSLLS